jgi:pSer/pThr/pTyr-binding forkhead associated (FHA) protein
LSVPIPYDWFFLGLRLAFVLVLYLFLWQALHIIMRDIRQAPVAPTKKRATRAKLVVIDPAESQLLEGATFGVSNKTTIGRHPDCTITIEEPFLSAIHAEFSSRDLAWYLIDRESTNGTFINGRPLRGTAYIESDDVLQFGRIKVRFTT